MKWSIVKRANKAKRMLANIGYHQHHTQEQKIDRDVTPPTIKRVDKSERSSCMVKVGMTRKEVVKCQQVYGQT